MYIYFQSMFGQELEFSSASSITTKYLNGYKAKQLQTTQ